MYILIGVTKKHQVESQMGTGQGGSLEGLLKVLPRNVRACQRSGHWLSLEKATLSQTSYLTQWLAVFIILITHQLNQASPTPLAIISLPVVYVLQWLCD